MIRPLLTFIATAVFGIAMLYIEGPGLWRDVQVRNASLVPARELKVEEAKCTAHWWIVSSCSIRYSAPQMPDKQSIRFTVFGTLGGERFQLMRAPDNRVTTDIGVAKIANRIAMALLLAVFMCGVCVFSFRKAVDAA